MRRIPAWGWSVVAVILVAGGWGLGGGGPEGRAVSRALYPIVVSLLFPPIVFSYIQQHLHPTRRLKLINAATVLALAYVTFPIWHFGVVLPQVPGDPVTVRWWVNGLVLVLAVGLFFLLVRLTRSLEPRGLAASERPEHLTV